MLFGLLQDCNLPLCIPECLQMYPGYGADVVLKVFFGHCSNILCEDVSWNVFSAFENRTKFNKNELTLKSQPWMLKGHKCSALTQCDVTWSSIMSRGISIWPQFKLQLTGNLRQSSEWAWNNNTFVKELEKTSYSLGKKIVCGGKVGHD